ncbi:MAG: hypothetical protein Q4E73_00205 [Lachnospiraceae bacterium]|nr:hypothetical protein [Lachnospiraceae bacterium]
MAILTRILSDLPWEQMLAQNSQEELSLMYERMGIADAWKISMQEPAKFLEEYLLERPEIVPRMLSEEEFDLLLLIWDGHPMPDTGDISRRNFKSLEKFGFLRYDHKEKTVQINEEAKHNFYFSFKGRAIQKQKEMYQEMEYTVKGILYFYGMIDLTEMYDIIKAQYDISFSMFWSFLTGRMELWSFLGILKNTQTDEYYAVSYEVRDRKKVFAGHMRREKQDYAALSVEEANVLGKMSGIGRWEGTTQLLAYALETLYKEMMPATVFVKTILIYIQNGDSLDVVKEKIDSKINDFSQEEREMVLDCIEDMYRYTPIYHLKGHNRYELEERTNRFSVIEGGRKD